MKNNLKHFQSMSRKRHRDTEYGLFDTEADAEPEAKVSKLKEGGGYFQI